MPPNVNISYAAFGIQQNRRRACNISCREHSCCACARSSTIATHNGARVTDTEIAEMASYVKQNEALWATTQRLDDDTKRWEKFHEQVGFFIVICATILLSAACDSI